MLHLKEVKVFLEKIGHIQYNFCTKEKVLLQKS